MADRDEKEEPDAEPANPEPEPETAAPRTARDELNDLLGNNGASTSAETAETGVAAGDTAADEPAKEAVHYFSIEKVIEILSERKQLRTGSKGPESVLMAAAPATITTLQNSKVEVKGTIFLSNFRLGFLCDDFKVLSVPLLSITKHRITSSFRNGATGSETDAKSKWTKVEGLKVSVLCLQQPLRRPAADGRLTAQVNCKDARVLRLSFCPDLRWPGSCRSLSEILQRMQSELGQILELSKLPFQLAEQAPQDSEPFLYNARQEYTRFMGAGQDNGCGWRLYNQTEDYALCSTYPQLLAVPQEATDQLVQKVALYRARGRLPVLCWLHPHVDDATATEPPRRAALIRCAQPNVGVCCRRSKADEKYLAMIAAQVCGEDSSGRRNLLILDARDKNAAQANRLRNGGYENYGSIEFAGIANIHAVRDSFAKMIRLHTGSRTRNFVSLRQVVATGWLAHIAHILKAVSRIVVEIDAPLGGRSVIVHCSDGWDRTPQLTSLAQICLDPFYRTLDGFRILVQKEWQSFGHKFRDRTWGADKKQQSPIFLQFLDCVHQLILQNPLAFEFNERLLVRLADYVYGQLAMSCPDFLFDSEREARQSEHGLIYTCWGYIHRENARGKYMNANYQSKGRVVIRVRDTVPLTVWTAFFKRWNRGPLHGASPSECDINKQTEDPVTWDIDNSHFAFRLLVEMPLGCLCILMAAVAALCVLGLFVNGRPVLNASTTGFTAARDTPAFNNENSFRMFTEFVALNGRTIFGAVPASADPPATCSDCASEIQLTVRAADDEGGSENVITAENLRAVCSLEKDMETVPKYSVSCKSSGGQCCPPESLPSLLASHEEEGCLNIDDVELQAALAGLEQCSQSTTFPQVELTMLAHEDIALCNPQRYACWAVRQSFAANVSKAIAASLDFDASFIQIPFYLLEGISPPVKESVPVVLTVYSGLSLATASAQVASLIAAATTETPMVSVSSSCPFSVSLSAIALGTAKRFAFEDGFKSEVASNLGNGSAVTAQQIVIDDIVSNGHRRLQSSFRRLSHAFIVVDFHFDVPYAAKDQGASLLHTLLNDNITLSVYIDGSLHTAETGSMTAVAVKREVQDDEENSASWNGPDMEVEWPQNETHGRRLLQDTGSFRLIALRFRVLILASNPDQILLDLQVQLRNGSSPLRIHPVTRTIDSNQLITYTFESWTGQPKWPPVDWCNQNRTLRARLVDYTFDGRTGTALSSKFCLQDSILQEGTDNAAWFLTLLREWQDENPGLAITVKNEDILRDFANQELSTDLERTWFIVLFIGLITLPLSGSGFSVVPSVLQDAAAWMLAYAFYGIVFDVEWFPFSNYSSVFILWCMGVNDKFLIWDLWSQPADCLVDTRLTWIWQRMFTPTLLSHTMCATSFGTCLFSSFPVVRLFGKLMVMLVAFRYVLNMTFFPTVLCVEHVTLRYIFGCCSCGEGDEKKHQSAKRCLICRPMDDVVRVTFNAVNSCRWVLVLILGLLGVLGAWNAATETRYSGRPFRLFASDNIFDEHAFSTTDFAASPGADDMHSGITVNLVWGLMPRDDGSQYGVDPVDYGQLAEESFDSTFDITDPSAQEWFVHLSKTLRLQSWVREEMPPTTFELFGMWLLQHSTTSSQLCHPGVGSELPISSAAFGPCFTQFVHESTIPGYAVSRTSFPMSSPPSLVLVMPVTTTMLFTWDRDKMSSQIQEFDSFWNQVMMDVPSSCQNGFFTSKAFVTHSIEKYLLQDVARATIVSVCVLVLILLVNTYSIGLAVLGLLSVVLAVACALGLIPVLNDQRFRDVLRRDDEPTLDFGILHSMTVPFLFGVCSHPVVLLSYLFITAPIDPFANVGLKARRVQRMKLTIRTAVPSIFWSSIGSIGIGLVMRTCTLAHFVDFANVVLAGSICSLLYAVGFFCSLLLVAGPASGKDPQSTWPSGFMLNQSVLTQLDDPLGSGQDAAIIVWDKLKLAKQDLKVSNELKDEMENRLYSQRERESQQAMQIMDSVRQNLMLNWEIF
eukprot:SAG31_NODE_883_length_11260_cov_38.912284_4_plen_2003_part_00